MCINGPPENPGLRCRLTAIHSRPGGWVPSTSDPMPDDDARRCSAHNPPGVPLGHHPLARLKAFRLARADGGQAGGVHGQGSQIVALVVCQEPGGKGRPVLQGYLKRTPADHVGVGEDEPVGVPYGACSPAAFPVAYLHQAGLSALQQRCHVHV